MEQHFKNGMAAAKFLEADPRVERVIFPGDGTGFSHLQKSDAGISNSSIRPYISVIFSVLFNNIFLMHINKSAAYNVRMVAFVRCPFFLYF